MTYPIPKDELDDRLAIVGTAGSGKTYLVLGAVEHLLARKSRIIGVDPLGVMWGLRLCADGKTASPFQPVIFGGAHGDLPINEHAGALIGQTVATMRESCILDLSMLGTKAAERRFMLAFLTSLYRETDKEPVHLIVDEADMFAPQKLLDKEGDAAKLLGMMETIVRRGRVKGFIPWLITQRPAVLSKDVLSQADGIVALKLTSSQDRDAIGAWIEGQADKAEGKAMLGSLPTKQRGEGVLWIPARGILRSVTFPEKATFDSSRTPKRGEKREARALRPLDLGALKERLATVEVEAKANDPKALRADLAKANAELVKLRAVPAPKPAGTDERAMADIAKLAAEAGIESVRQAFREAVAPVREWLSNEISAALGRCSADLSRVIGNRIDGIERGVMAVRATKTDFTQSVKPALAVQRVAPPRLPSPATASRTNGHDDLPTPHRRVLASISFWASVGHAQPTREQVAGVAGYSPGSGGFNNILGTLATQGLIDKPGTGRVSLTASAPVLSMTPSEAREKLISVLSGPERRIVDALGGSTDPVARDEVARRTDYSAGSGGFNNLIGHLCTLCVLTKPGTGQVALSPWAAEVIGNG